MSDALAKIAARAAAVFDKPTPGHPGVDVVDPYKVLAAKTKAQYAIDDIDTLTQAAAVAKHTGSWDPGSAGSFGAWSVLSEAAEILGK